MSAALVFAVFAVTLIAATVFYLFFYRTWRRERELRVPFPDLWRRHLESSVPLYRKLSEPLKQALEQRAREEITLADNVSAARWLREQAAGLRLQLALDHYYRPYVRRELEALSVMPRH